MQKKLIALAVAALAAGSAFAQSNVTVYGRINAYVESTGDKSPTGGALDDRSKSRIRATCNSCNVGFRGEEDLGGGLKAWFQVESNAGVTDGTGTWDDRNSGVGFKGNWGQFMIGTWDLYYFDHGWATGMGLLGAYGASDLAILNGMGVGAVAGSSAALSASGTTEFAPTRARNQIKYSLPNINGFTGYLAYSAGNTNLLNSTAEGRTVSGTTTADEQTWAANATYFNGPIFASLSYFKTTDYALTKDTDRDGWKLAGSYDFATGTHVGLTWEQLKQKQVADAFGNTKFKRNAWVAHVGQTFGKHNISLFYAQAGDAKLSTGKVTDSSAKWVALQYTYTLSKRTNVYAGAAKLNNDTNATYQFFGGLGAASASAGANPTSLWVGMAHAF